MRGRQSGRQTKPDRQTEEKAAEKKKRTARLNNFPFANTKPREQSEEPTGCGLRS